MHFDAWRLQRAASFIATSRCRALSALTPSGRIVPLLSQEGHDIPVYRKQAPRLFGSPGGQGSIELGRTERLLRDKGQSAPATKRDFELSQYGDPYAFQRPFGPIFGRPRFSPYKLDACRDNASNSLVGGRRPKSRWASGPKNGSCGQSATAYCVEATMPGAEQGPSSRREIRQPLA